MAETTSQKHQNFIKEQMRDKPVNQVAGIGEKISGELNDQGFKYAYQLLGQFLILNKNEGDFLDWFKEVAPSANSKHRQDAYECLSKWCELML
ncbi:barrier-to-autointegration factor [Capsaspora owczarzaki ATCC 30864]|uniref:Barrier-to-autointegration factor 1 n=1 Tax=Capsaspora owczarzaki (strain ATCC 30864) TaxID=595528 RepID=A0A0D2WWV1_CAPO3|nr:barrier-to-autointegration factor [Capsaspora owczarzaki ATCC 30864]KJE97083.1 barrier-to-autointegration factor [Capsaspora owczarzaki ATCC 30864]|eukprot:XP_004343428.1 barrier-to-autointegration factor [Capsaspora owczarzaki ATCC 30864]